MWVVKVEIGYCECGGAIVTYDGVYAVCKKCGKIFLVDWSLVG